MRKQLHERGAERPEVVPDSRNRPGLLWRHWPRRRGGPNAVAQAGSAVSVKEDQRPGPEPAACSIGGPLAAPLRDEQQCRNHAGGVTRDSDLHGAPPHGKERSSSEILGGAMSDETLEDFIADPVHAQTAPL